MFELMIDTNGTISSSVIVATKEAAMVLLEGVERRGIKVDAVRVSDVVTGLVEYYENTKALRRIRVMGLN